MREIFAIIFQLVVNQCPNINRLYLFCTKVSNFIDCLIILHQRLVYAFEKLEVNNSFSEIKKLYFNMLSKNSVMGQIFCIIINMRGRYRHNILAQCLGTMFLLNVKSF